MTLPQGIRPDRDWLRFAAPWLAGLIFLTLLPAGASLALSFFRWDGLSLHEGIRWAGLDNYRDLLIEPPTGTQAGREFRHSITNSLCYTLMVVPACLIASLAVAVLLNVRVRGIAWYRTIIVSPYLLGGVATIMIWSWLLNPQFGPINDLLRTGYTALDPLVRLVREQGTADWKTPNWLYSPIACKPALVIMNVWLAGGSTLVLLAALQRVPRSLLEAAALDGAGRFRRFLHVTIPHISHALVFNAVVGMIFAMQTFDDAYLLQNRAQRDGLSFGVLFLFREAFEPPYRKGRAAAAAWILLTIIAALTIPMFLFARRRAFYRIVQ